MYQADALAIASGITETQLIENAGRAVAEEITRRYGARKTVALCGPGNNGADGKVAARHLKQWGWPVTISDDITGAGLIIDALYGAGLNRDFPLELANRINNAGVPIIAIDVPSGLDGLTGQPRGACVTAHLTITFFRKKPADLLLPGRMLCGEVVVAEIGIAESVLTEINQRLWENTRPNLPSFELSIHKYQRGHAVIVSGAKFNTGASRLAAQAALKTGAGLVTIAGHQDELRVHAAHTTAIMLAQTENASALGMFLTTAPQRRLLRPAAGIGSETCAKVRAVLASGAATVLDADALTSFAQNRPNSSPRSPNFRGARLSSRPMKANSPAFSVTSPCSGTKHQRALKAAKRCGATIILKVPTRSSPAPMAAPQ